jgi:hypothetical protein
VNLSEEALNGIIRALVQVEDTPSSFPKGKWATIQHLEKMRDESRDLNVEGTSPVQMPIRASALGEGGQVMNADDVKGTETRRLLVEALRAKGYDGLFNSWGDCACKLEDLAPCSSDCLACEPGYLLPAEDEGDWERGFSIGLKPEKEDAQS